MKKSSFPTTVALLACIRFATSLAVAEESARKDFGKEHPFRIEDLPAGKLKTNLQSLKPQAKENALKWLHTFDFDATDAAVHLRVDHGGGIYVVCPDEHQKSGRHSHAPDTPEELAEHSVAPKSGSQEPAQTSESPPTASAAVSVSVPPAYHSRPGATRKIYLDFNGGIVTGTAWNTDPDYGMVASWDAKVWSQDADRTTFNDAEQTWMKRIWQRLAEDYAPFDVDVTTDVAYDPDTYAGNKDNVGWLMICETLDKNNVALPHNGYGGVAYVGVFGESTYSPTYQPAWVSSTNGGGSESIVAEAASHEMGHNMGLSHDSTTTSTTGYYGGHGSGDVSWGPIMGTGYDRNVSQWSKGEYYQATQLQDDLAIISSRVPYRSDDHGATAGTATPLTIINTNTISSTTPENDPSNSNPVNKGVIQTNTDVDVFSFYTGAGAVQLTVNPWIQPAGYRGGNLDVLLELYNEAGTMVASNNNANLTYATIGTTLTQGFYYLHVRNTGTGTPLVSPPAGYTVYGSIGQYFISGTIVDADPPLSLAGITPASGDSGNTVTVDITGTLLSTNTTIKLKKSGRADITGTSIQMIGDTLRCQFDLTGAITGAWDLVATNPNLETSTLSAAFTVNGVLATVWSENFDGTVSGWTSQATKGSNSWSVTTAQSQSPAKSYFAPGPPSITTAYLTSPSVSVPGDSTSLQFKFWHNHNLESSKDGGRFEFSIDGGAWFDVTDSGSGAAFASNGYNSTLSNTGGGPNTPGDFGGRSAWSGNSGGFIQTTVNLTDLAKYAGKSLRARWGIATNASTSSTGWYVDSVSLLSDSIQPNQPPAFSVAASTSSSETQTDPGPIVYQIVRGVGTNLSLTATDDAGESALIYTWQSTGPAPVVLSINGNNAAKSTTATFSTIGDYVLTVTAMDTGALSTTSSVNVRVLSTDSLVVTPSSGSLTVGNTLQFSAVARDQFGTILASQPSPINWSTSGGGALDSNGLFTATNAGGPFTITATSGVSYSAIAQVVVNPISATVTLGNLTPTYDGNPKLVTVSTNPTPLAYAVTYAGSSTAPTNAGTYAVVATITDPNYAGSASGSLVIAKASQTINFAALDPIADDQPPSALTATATSGLPVSYASSNTSVATVSGNTVTLVGLGSTTITASQAGNTNYNAATSVPQTLTVVRANPLAVFTGAPYKVLIGQTLSLNGSASQPSYGESITTYEWDLNNDNTFGDATGATPSPISFAALTGSWGMVQGLNTIKLKVTDSASKTSIVSATVELVLNLTWDANATGSGQTNGAGAWLALNQWWDGAANQTWASGSNATFGGPSTAGGAVTLASPTSVNAITFNTFTGTYTLGTAGQTLTINSGITKNVGSGIVTIISPLSLGVAQTWTNNSAAAINVQAATTLNGVLTVDGSGVTSFDNANAVIGGSGGIIKNGTGQLNLSGGATPLHIFTGDITVNGGSIGFQTAAFLTGRNVKLTHGYLGGRYGSGFTWTSGLGTGANQIQITGGTSGFSGEGTSGSAFQIGTALSTLKWGATGENGATGFFNPTVFLANGDARMNTNGNGSLNNGIDLNAATRTITSLQTTDGAAGSGFTISGVISNSSGTAGLIKTGVGNLILGSANTYNGDTTISGGTLQIGNNTAGSLGNGTYNSNIFIAGGATLRVYSSANQTLGGTISGGGGLVKSYAGTLTLSNSNTYTGKTSLTPQTTAGAGTLSVSSFNSVNGGTPLLASSSLGAPTTPANGTIDFGSTAAQGAVTLKYTGNGETTDRVINFLFNGSGVTKTLDASGAGLLKFTSTFTGSGSTTNDIALQGSSNGEIVGGLPFTFRDFSKLGNGTWTLGGTSSFTGTTTITAGKLALGASNVLPNASAVSIANATLDAATFSDTVGTLDVTSTATINLGTGAALAFANSSAIDWTGGTLNLTGTFVPGSSLRFGTSNTGLTTAQLAKISSAGFSNFILDASGYLTVDNTPPTLTGSGIVDDKSGAPIIVNTLVIYTVTFSEDMDASTVTAADFGNAGSSAVTIGTVAETSPTSGVFTVQATPTSGGTLQLRVNAAAVLKDVAGNNLNTTAAVADDTIIMADGTAPMLAGSGIVDDKSGAPIPVNTLVTYTVTFSEDMDAASVSAADFGNAGSAAFTIGTVTETSPGVFSVQATPTSAGTLQLQIPVSAVLNDVAGNNLDNDPALADDTTLTVDGTVPTLAGNAIVDDKSGAPITVDTLVIYTVTFSEDMDAASVSAADFGNAGGSAVTFGTVTETSPGVFIVQATPTSGGTLQLQVNQNASLKDFAGNNLDTTSPILDDTTVTVDGTLPTLTSIADDKSGGPVTANTLVTYTVAFSEDMDASTVTAADFGNAGGSAVTFGTVTETSPGVFIVQATPTSGGTLQLQVNQNASLKDLAGNNLDTTSPILDDTTVTVDGTLPTLTSITDDKSGGPVTANTLVTYTVAFSEDMDATTVTAADFGNAGNSAVTIGTVTETTPGVFTIPVTPTSGGTLQLQVNQNASLKDLAGNNLDTTSPILDDTTVTVDGTLPTLTSITDDKSGGPVTANTLVTYTVAFSEDMDASTVTAADFGNAGGSAVTFGTVTETTPGVFVVPVTPISGGTLQLQVNQNASLKDLAGNNLDTTSPILDDTIVTVDGTLPTLTSIADDKSGGPVTANTLVTYTVAFSEDMDATTVTAADFGNAGNSAVTIGTVTETTPGVFTIPVTPTSGGTLQLQVNQNASLKDVAGNSLVTTSPIPDDTTLTVNILDPYVAWSGGAAFNADANNDGVENGLAWLLGAETPSSNATGKLPKATFDGGNLVLTFDCLSTANRGSAVLEVQYSKDLGATDHWSDNKAAVPGAVAAPVTVNNVTFVTSQNGDLIHIQATIPASAASPTGKLFGRLHSTSD